MGFYARFFVCFQQCLQGLTAADSALGGMRNDHSSTVKKPGFSNKSVNNKATSHIRRPSAGSGPPAKKPKPTTLKDVTLTEAGKYGTLNEYAFFDKVYPFSLISSRLIIHLFYEYSL